MSPGSAAPASTPWPPRITSTPSKPARPASTSSCGGADEVGDHGRSQPVVLAGRGRGDRGAAAVPGREPDGQAGHHLLHGVGGQVLARHVDRTGLPPATDLVQDWGEEVQVDVSDGRAGADDLVDERVGVTELACHEGIEEPVAVTGPVTSRRPGRGRCDDGEPADLDEGVEVVALDPQAAAGAVRGQVALPDPAVDRRVVHVEVVGHLVQRHQPHVVHASPDVGRRRPWSHTLPEGGRGHTLPCGVTRGVRRRPRLPVPTWRCGGPPRRAGRPGRRPHPRGLPGPPSRASPTPRSSPRPGPARSRPPA